MAKARQHIPQSEGELTPGFFTDVIGARYHGEVTSVSTEVIGVGVGFMGELHRCRLTWLGASESAPSSVVAKLPSTHTKNRSVGEMLLSYEREIHVYSEMRDGLGFPMPEHLYSAMDPNPAPWLSNIFMFLFERLPIGAVSWLLDRLTGLSGKSRRRYLLIMEDISDARPPAQVVGGTVDDALAGLRLLAEFHATNWMAEHKLSDQPTIWGLDYLPKVVQASFRRNRDSFVARFGEILGEAKIEKMDDIQETNSEAVRSLAKAPWTLIHGDYRLDNLLFRPDGSAVVVDFQALGHGRAGWDVAYFITTALEPTHRSEEDLMLRTYHEALLGHGVTDYSFDDLLTDTRLTKHVLAHRMVAGDDLIDTDFEGSSETLVEIMVRRIAGWVEA